MPEFATPTDWRNDEPPGKIRFGELKTENRKLPTGLTAWAPACM